LRRNFVYGIYFNKFQVRGNLKKWPYIFGNTFTFCTDIPFAEHFNCAGKKVKKEVVASVFIKTIKS
jgi:hypothetical protein